MRPGNKRKLNRGFTLIESLVAVGLFGLIISVAVGGFVKALRTQSQVTALLAANGNASLAIEQIAREIRTGYNFKKCASPNLQFGFCEDLEFTNSSGRAVVYEVDSDNGRGFIAKSEDGGVPVRVTADNVDVKYMDFYMEGERKGDGEPPRITVSIGVAPGGGSVGEMSITRIQTTISARQSDE